MTEIKNQRVDAMAYLEKHKILRLFDILGVKLAQQKPESPNEFIVKELQDISESKSRKEPVSVFTDDDIDNIFGIFDITNRGYLDNTQLIKALAAVGINEPRSSLPAGDRIDRETFNLFMYDIMLLGQNFDAEKRIEVQGNSL